MATAPLIRDENARSTNVLVTGVQVPASPSSRPRNLSGTLTCGAGPCVF